MSDTLQKRVASGVALLDELMPGWARHIDLRQLRMESCDTCVLGQLYQSYSFAPILKHKEGNVLRYITYDEAHLYDIAQEWDKEALACAFEYPYYDGEDVTPQEWRQAWVEAIKHKRKEKTL